MARGTNHEFQGGKKVLEVNQSPMANELINHASVMTPPQKPKKEGCRELPGWGVRTLP